MPGRQSERGKMDAGFSTRGRKTTTTVNSGASFISSTPAVGAANKFQAHTSPIPPDAIESPRWISGSDIIFKTPKAPSPAKTRRRTTMVNFGYPGLSKLDSTEDEFRRSSMVVKSPPGVKTRSRRSSVYVAIKSKGTEQKGVETKKLTRAGKTGAKKETVKLTSVKAELSLSLSDLEIDELAKIKSRKTNKKASPDKNKLNVVKESVSPSSQPDEKNVRNKQKPTKILRSHGDKRNVEENENVERESEVKNEVASPRRRRSVASAPAGKNPSPARLDVTSPRGSKTPKKRAAQLDMSFADVKDLDVSMSSTTGTTKRSLSRSRLASAKKSKRSPVEVNKTSPVEEREKSSSKKKVQYSSPPPSTPKAAKTPTRHAKPITRTPFEKILKPETPAKYVSNMIETPGKNILKSPLQISASVISSQTKNTLVREISSPNKSPSFTSQKLVLDSPILVESLVSEDSKISSKEFTDLEASVDVSSLSGQDGDEPSNIADTTVSHSGRSQWCTIL